MKPQERAKELAAAHWGYTGKLLELTGVVGCDYAICEYLYKAAAVHFYGHAVEDCQNGMFGIFGDDVDEVALEAELDRSSGNAAADAEHSTRTKDLFTRGCPTCLDSAACAKAMATDRNGKCLYHRLRNGSLCAYCHRPPMCSGDYPVTKDGGCEGYISALRENMLDAKQEAPTAADLPLDFTLPSITLKCTAEEAWKKYESELLEWADTEDNSTEELVERWDCIQALRTYYERGGDVKEYQHGARVIMEEISKWYAEGRDVMGAKASCLLKNAERGYYSPEVNAAIIASKGHRFQPLDEMGVI